jgi:hypothetical protein
LLLQGVKEVNTIPVAPNPHSHFRVLIHLSSNCKLKSPAALLFDYEGVYELRAFSGLIYRNPLFDNLAAKFRPMTYIFRSEMPNEKDKNRSKNDHREHE